MTPLLSKLLTVNWYVEKHVCILTFHFRPNFWDQLLEHLCLFWTLTAAERSAPTLDLMCSPLLTLRRSPACQDTPSPILLLPKPRSTGSSEGNFKPSSLYSAEKKPSSSKTQSVQSVASLSSLKSQTSPLQAPIRTTAVEVKQHRTDLLCSFCSFCVWIRF